MNLTTIPRRIDDFALDRIFQPIVDRFPDAGPAGVARFFLTGTFFADVAKNLISKESYLWILADFVGAAVLYLAADSPAARLGSRNARRITQFGWRLLFLVITPAIFIGTFRSFTLLKLLNPADALLFLSYLYSVACDRMPPRQTESAWTRWSMAS
ncbi:hypothetical protein [Rhodopila sp.]|uniref:hypothetical protein n=1 Tax=Rhodopila sp. TaxID=2480087 RepID=UPI003D14BED7